MDLGHLVVTVRAAAVLGWRKAPKTSIGSVPSTFHSSECPVAIDGEMAFVLEPLIKLHTIETEPLFHGPEGGLMDEEELNGVFGHDR